MSEVAAILQVGPLPIKIVLKDLGEDAVGKYVFEEGTIYLSPKLRGAQAEVTLGHEIGHAWLTQSGIDLPKKLKESICDVIGFGLMSLLRENPGLDAVFSLIGAGK